MEMDRRTALVLLSTALARGAGTKPQFFSPEEFRLVDQVSELIIPADAHSPGAQKAQVAVFVDLVCANSAPATQRNWRARLQGFDAGARRAFGRSFVELGAGEQHKWMDRACSREEARTPAGLFFADLREATLFAYYTTRIGLQQELGYAGNSMMGDFPGCRG